MAQFAVVGRLVRRGILATALPVLAFAGVPASAAPITWSSPTAIGTSADTALTQPGTLQYAVAWGISTSTMVTLTSGSVTFQVGTLNGSNPYIATANVQGIATNSPSTSLFVGTTNSAFNSVLGGFARNGPDTYTLMGLTVGQSYSVQIFSVDDRATVGAYTQWFAGPSGGTSTSFAHNANDFIIGTFVADATTETISAFSGTTTCTGTPGYCNVVNAMVVRSTSTSIPEPFTVAVLGTGLFGLALFRRRRTPAARTSGLSAAASSCCLLGVD